MLNRLVRLRRNDQGVGAVEFALVAPVLITFIIGTAQMGKLFFANADMKNAIAAGARVAELYPVPEDDTIIAAVNDRLVRTGAESKATATVVHGEDEDDNPYVEINMTYTVPLDFIFFSVSPVSLTDTRRVFTQVESANSTTYTSTTTGGTTTGGTTTGGTTTGGTTSSTTTGGTTSSTTSGGTTTGGTTSTSSTSASSTGGTSATSASSTSSTSSTSTSSTSSGSTSSGSNGNGSNGNGSSSSSSNGHAHGNCSHC
jgi:Flp pilus assembly protein TadG